MQLNWRKLTITCLAIIFTLAITSCNKNDDDSLETECVDLYQAAVQSYNDFIDDPSEAACEEYKKVAQDYIDGCDDLAGYDETWEDQIQATVCSIYGN